jgi:hypothetical protein
MAALVAAIHTHLCRRMLMDRRHEAGDDEFGMIQFNPKRR